MLTNKIYSKALLLVFTSLLLVNCQEKDTPQKPVSKSNESIIKSSVDRNKELITDEQILIKNYIDADKANTYSNNSLGFWYAYENRHAKDSIRPIVGDIVNYKYEISTLTDSIIYTKSDIGSMTYEVDKQDILPVLKNSLKFMKKDETIKVLTPSSLAFGYLGDQNKIKKNQPLVFTITLESISKTNF